LGLGVDKGGQVPASGTGKSGGRERVFWKDGGNLLKHEWRGGAGIQGKKGGGPGLSGSGEWALLTGKAGLGLCQPGDWGWQVGGRGE